MNDFTKEEIALVNKHRVQTIKAAEVAEVARRQQAIKAAEVAEVARRQQAIHKTVADLIGQAKSILVDAKQIAKDNGMEYQIGDMVTNMLAEVSEGHQWYGSDASLC